MRNLSTRRCSLAILAFALWTGGAARSLAGPEKTAPAPARRHWAFEAPQRPEAPAVSKEGWARTELDRFILARLEKEGWTPSSEADRATLLRRLSLDLTGLPPSPEEIDAFVGDTGAEAYPKQVERLLASPHHGEKWARHWLDAARYADSNGYEKDLAREMWHWRDWVIAALNRDLPYDRFLVEQLAGDLLEEPTQEQIVATGFLRNSMINEEGAIDPEQFRMEAMFDRMDCIGKSLLGLTVQCAQCHDHKYDPFLQRDYYRLLAFFNNDNELKTPFYSAEELRARDAVLREIREAEEDLRRRTPDWREREARWEGEAAERWKREAGRWIVLEPFEHGDPGGLSKLQLQADRSLLAGGHPFTGGTWRVRARTGLTGLRAVRLELFTNGNLPRHGPGRSAQGLFALTEMRLETSPASPTAPVGSTPPVADPAKAVKVSFVKASADFEEPLHTSGDADEKKRRSYGPVKFAVDGDDKTSWTIDAGPGRRNSDREAVFVSREPFGFEGGSELTFYFQNEDEIACFRLSVSSDEGATADPVPHRVREALARPEAERSPAERALIFSYWRTTVSEFAETNQKIDAIWKRHPETGGSALVLERRRVTRPTHMLNRGDWLQPQAEVDPGVPAFLNPLPEGAPPTRLGFARWLTSREAPTTARVIVNRIWQSYFGAGIVSTTEDLGAQGEPPTHRELLDWLACELMEPRARLPGETAELAPWSLKHLHRIIVHSAAYRQSSRVGAAELERDPRNRFLSRGARLRVDGEGVRDISLAVAGLLNPKVGGPSIFTPAPEFLFRPPTSYAAFPWNEEKGPNRYRRALYTFRRRSTPYPALLTFDAPSGEIACVRRSRSNTPLQALTTLNETLFVEAARAFARRIVAEGGKDDGERIEWAFRRAVGRRPSETEAARLRTLLEKQRRRIAEGWINPWLMITGELGTGASTLPKNLPAGATPADFAAYTIAARVLLNLDETITKE